MPSFKLKERFKKIDKAAVIVLLCSVIVGTLAGVFGALFNKAVTWIVNFRTASVAEVSVSLWVSIPLMFVISGLLAMFGYLMVQRVAPEAGGSGIPEIEGSLQNLRPVRWWRVLPAKLLGGIGTLGSGMVLGREGPTVQMGANAGQMVHDVFKLNNPQSRHTLLATGAAAGLAAAFNAPLAGILLIIEEMREEFRYNLISIKAVFIGVIMSTVMVRYMDGNKPLLQVVEYVSAPMNTYWLYLVLGICFGLVGVLFNYFILRVQSGFQTFNAGGKHRFILMGGLVGGVIGAVGVVYPSISGDGFHLIDRISTGQFSLALLALIFFFRFITSVVSFSSGAPGGIFSPLLALGTLFGTAFGLAAVELFPHYDLQAGSFAVAGMAALFAATVRAPLTGIVLVLEITGNYLLILPIVITCLGATMMAHLIGGKPLYSQLLERILLRAKKEEDETQTNHSITHS